VDTSKDAACEFERAATDLAHTPYVLQLYIAGSSLRSQRAILNVQKICQEILTDVYELQVIDIFQQPLLAKAEQIFAVPTLVKKLPVPKRLFIGDMSDTNAIVTSLDS
jgi:circadian clock protein KaiB